MRIISGLHKGRKIQAPKNLPVRPTTDRSKEGLFNILQHRINLNGTQVLDLFAGTGNISYEFASRGAAHVTALDQHRKCVQFIQKTTTSLNLEITVLQGETVQFLEQNTKQYDLIFADPPYDIEEEAYHEIVSLGRKSLQANGMLIIEHFKQIDLSTSGGYLFDRKYGNNVFSFFIK